MFLQEPIGSGGSGDRTRFLERSPRTLKALEGRVLVQAPSPKLTPMLIMSNQQPTGYSWRSPAGNPPTSGSRQAPQSEVSPRHLLKLPTAPLELRPRQLLLALPRRRSHRPRRLREVLQLIPTSPLLELSTPPLVLRPRQLLQALLMRRSHRSRRLRMVLILLTSTSLRLEPPTPPQSSQNLLNHAAYLGS